MNKSAPNSVERIRARTLAGAWSILLAFAPTKPSAQQNLTEPLREVFEAGVAAERARRLEEAEKDFRLVLQRAPQVAFVHHNLGTVYQQRGDHVRAITQFREAIRLQPDYLAPHVLLGASLLAIGQVPEAVRELERAVNLAPRQTLPREELAKAYGRANNLAAMLDQYRALQQLAPHDSEYTYQAGQTYLRIAQWAFEQMKRLDPQSPRMYETLAEAYRTQGQMSEAIRSYQRAVQADPSLPGIHLALAQIYLEKNDIEDADREIKLELAIVPESLAAEALHQKIVTAKRQP